jgi:hypothetical protein
MRTVSAFTVRFDAELRRDKNVSATPRLAMMATNTSTKANSMDESLWRRTTV